MSPDLMLECPRTSFRDVLRENVTERVWIFPLHKVRAMYFYRKRQRGKSQETHTTGIAGIDSVPKNGTRKFIVDLEAGETTS